MNTLHAHWRMPYVEAPNKQKIEHLFSELPKNTNDEAVYILLRNKHSYLVLNIYPYNAGHILAVPYQAVQTLSELPQEAQLDLLDSITKAQSILTQSLNPEGFNIGINIGKAAGAGIPEHLHVHIVPRWNGDTNFMPVLNDTKVLPESLNYLWQRLRPIADQFITQEL